jgi:hypothetical protein
MKSSLAVATLICAIAATAAAQTPTPAPGETTGRLSKLPPEAASLGGGGVVLPGLGGGGVVLLPGGGGLVLLPGLGGGTGVAYASIDLTCGNNTYTVTTGNNHGQCKSGGNGNNAICDDGHGNGAEVLCSSGCTSSSGSGACTKARGP